MTLMRRSNICCHATADHWRPWKRSVIQPIYKSSGAPTDTSSFRSISFVPCLSKIIEWLVHVQSFSLATAFSLPLNTDFAKKKTLNQICTCSGYRSHFSPVADPGFGQGRGQPAKRGPQVVAGPSSCDGPFRDLRAKEGHLRLQTLRAHYELRRPFGLLREPLQTLRGPPYEFRGSLRSEGV